MLDHVASRHAEVRMRQRGLRNADLDLVLLSATQVSSDSYVLTDADVMREITRRKREVQQLERLRGLKVVVQGGTIVTAFHARPAEAKRTFRRGRAGR